MYSVMCNILLENWYIYILFIHVSGLPGAGKSEIKEIIKSNSQLFH